VTPSRPNAVQAYTAVLLRHADRYLLLQRAATKRFAPGRWTGVGGLVEPDEMEDLRTSALREVREETGITPAEIASFLLRRVLLHARPGGPLTLLLYYTGVYTGVPEEPSSGGATGAPPCSEGTLYWLRPEDLSGLDIIETSREVLPALIADEARDPAGHEPIQLGAVHYGPDGTMGEVVWA
jgi:8-oxo-dGTP diphosphatase